MAQRSKPRHHASLGGVMTAALCLAVCVAACGTSQPPARSATAEHEGEPAPAPNTANEAASAAPRWLKGQLHLHSNASGDSETPPHDVARWYAEHDYDFIVFTDHNRITEIEGPEGLLVFPGIELTQNLDVCDPPPEPGLACLLHVNGLFVGTDTEALSQLPSPQSPDRLELFSHALRATEALGGVAMLNHPNFHYAADPGLIVALSQRGLVLFELANEAVDSNNEGDATHPSVEAMWDSVLSTGARVWGVATDDAHHYYDAAAVRGRGELAHVGDRGWIMVRATPERTSIRAAIERGEFYSTSGPLLETIELDGKTLHVTASDSAKRPLDFVVIGNNGELLAEQRGHAISFTAPATYKGYLRVRVRGRRDATAWTQPVWID